MGGNPLTTFDSGAVRDSSEDKPRYDLISPIALQRWAYLMTRGANKYAARNWEQGMPTSRCLEAAMRHLIEWYNHKYYGIEPYDMNEDHLAAVLFNVGAIIHFEGTVHDDLQKNPHYSLFTVGTTSKTSGS